MYYGSCEPAVVINENPLFIAVYTEDIDFVLTLFFPGSIRKEYPLGLGTKLLSVNTYGGKVQSDVVHGPKSSHMWSAFWPIIAEFVSDDYKKIMEKKAKFSQDSWAELYRRGREKLKSDDIIYRNGMPFSSCIDLDDNRRVKIKGEVNQK